LDKERGEKTKEIKVFIAQRAPFSYQEKGVAPGKGWLRQGMSSKECNSPGGKGVRAGQPRI